MVNIYKCNNPRCERNGIEILASRAIKSAEGGVICARCRRKMIPIDTISSIPPKSNVTVQ